MRQHTLVGERILRAAPALHSVAKLVGSSHERFDGTGYPDGLVGQTIQLGARIVSACDPVVARALCAEVDSARELPQPAVA